MFGYSLEELHGHTINETIVPVDLRHEGNELSHRVLKGEPVMTESVRITKQGTPLDVNIYGVPILINGQAVGVFGMYVDITEKKRAEEQRLELLRHLEATNKELNDFAYIVSHDLKAPLRAIGSLASWLASDHAEKLGDEGKELVSLLLARTKRMHDLIEGVLRYSRIARSREEVKEVNLGELVPDVVELLSPPAHVQVKIHDPLPIIRCEPTKMQQVFQNLVSNAVKFMDKPQGLVEIGCARENGHWRFYVRDNGPGIEERHFEKIFQIFQTLAPRDEYESTGIGLTVVKKIIESHGGRIWVESKLGAGTTFHFTVPLETTN
jgi:PAS domain S-box-containing protein